VAVKLSATAKVLSSKRNIEPNLIVEIDGITTIFSTIETLKAAKYGEDGIYYGMPGLVYGGSVEIGDSKNYISLGGGGPTISQQLQQDKGATQSVSSLNLEFIDNNGEMTEIISPGIILDEILGVKARVFLNFKGGRHPDDSVLIHRGIIDAVETQPASIKLNIAHPESQKRQELFIKTNVQLDGAIDAVQTTITATSTVGFILPTGTEILSYIKAEDEIIQFTGISGNSFTGCIRGALGSIADAHDDDSDVESFYRLQGNALDLALQLMLSQGPEYFATNVKMLHIGALSPIDIRPNYILFPIFDVEEQYGLVKGDFITITGSATSDVVDAVITGFGQTSGGESYIVTSTVFAAEHSTVGLASFKSKYAVLTEGMGMTPQDVDVARHEDYKTKFTSQIPSYDFYIKDTIKGKEFLSGEIYFPAGLYSLPRKSRASVGITIPPLSDQVVPILNEDTVLSPGGIKTARGINKDFYNAVIYKYNELPLEEKFISSTVGYSANSERIKNTGNKPLTIKSKGLRDTGGSQVIIRNTTRRLLERYEYAAESLPGIKVLYKTGFNIDVGDVVVFGSAALKIADTSSGTRLTPPRLYEVVNKKLNVKTGDISLDLLSTAFNLDGRYGVMSPATKVASGSTTSVINIKDSFSTLSPDLEREKWSDYIGETVLFHSVDWSYQEQTVLVGFSPGDDYKMIVNPPLSAPPLEDYIIDIALYGNTTDKTVNEKYKLIHCYIEPQVSVASGSSSTVFDVDGGDIGKFFVGSILRVHDFDYSDDSPEVRILTIVGNTITVDAALGFTPNNTHYIDLIGFIDEGLPYRYI